LSRLLVAEGDVVAAGQPVAEVASAGLLALQREFVDAAASAELAEAQLRRDQGLYSDGIIAERRLQETNTAARAAASALDQAHQQLALAGVTSAQIDTLRETRRLTTRLELRAPFAGAVVEQLNTLGAQVDSLEPVYRIANLATLWLEVHVPQERAARIAPGMRVVVAAGGRALDAEVTRVGQVVDAVSQTVLIRAEVENQGALLRAGQFLPARILTAASGEPVAVVPSAGVVRNEGVAAVFVRAGDDVAARHIDIVSEDGARTYIGAGLEADTEVAVAGVATLKSVWLADEAE